jgi:hypothetical protein
MFLLLRLRTDPWVLRIPHPLLPSVRSLILPLYPFFRVCSSIYSAFWWCVQALADSYLISQPNLIQSDPVQYSKLIIPLIYYITQYTSELLLA